MKSKGGKKLKWRILFACLLTTAVLYTPFLIVNNLTFQQWFLTTYRPLEPWKVGFQSLRVQPFPLRVKMKGLKLEHPEGHQISFDKIHFKVKLWRLLRGQIALSPFELDSPTIALAAPLEKTEKEKRNRFKLRTLLLIQNLFLENGRIKNFALLLPNNKKLIIDKTSIGLEPSLRGGTFLRCDLKNIQFEDEKGKNEGAEDLGVQVRTNFNHWSKDFPYVDDVDGGLQLKNGFFANLELKDVSAALRLEKGKLSLKKFSLQVGENVLLGQLESDIQKQTFLLNLETPDFISIPEIKSPFRTFNIAGDLKLAFRAEGKGFQIKKSSGKGFLNATHRFKNFEDHPAEVGFQFNWQNGILKLEEGKVTSDNADIKATGTLSLTPPDFNLKFASDKFPIQRFFEKFEDENLHPIHGEGAFQGSLQGFGKKIHLTLTGEALEGGYGLLAAPKAKVELDLTHEQLKLKGLILSEEKATGEAEFIINYGPGSKEDGPRPKKISLDAKLNEHPLRGLIPDLPLSGTVDAEFRLKGIPPKDIDGRGELIATGAEFLGMSFENINLPFHLTYKKLELGPVKWASPNAKTEWVRPLTLDFQPAGFDLLGSPFDGLQVDIQYLSPSKDFLIRKLNYKNNQDPSFWFNILGKFSPEAMGLKGEGRIDLATLEFLSGILREGSGPLSFKIAMDGKIADPKINGQIHFENDLISLRIYPLTVEELTGTVSFHDNRLSTENLKGLLGAGSFELKGSIVQEQWRPSVFDLALQGNQLYFRTKKGEFRMEYDADLTLKGQGPNTKLKGALTILDGRYTKDFNIIEEIKEGAKPPREIAEQTKEGLPIALDVNVRNLGDLLIDNNVGRIELATNVHVGGTRWTPTFDGSLEVTEGKIHYLGLDFEITHGFMEFRDPYTNPYLEVEGEQEIGDAHIVARLHGQTDNLIMDLEGNSAALGPLDRKDVISLILFGMTTQEGYATAQFQQLQLGPELVVEQAAHALERPFARLTKLDVLRLESKPTEQGRIRQFHIGKNISDRLHVEFSSEVERENALQTFLLEYWLTDFLIFKGARQSKENYQMNIGLRFQSQ